MSSNKQLEQKTRILCQHPSITPCITQDNEVAHIKMSRKPARDLWTDSTADLSLKHFQCLQVLWFAADSALFLHLSSHQSNPNSK